MVVADVDIHVLDRGFDSPSAPQLDITGQVSLTGDVVLSVIRLDGRGTVLRTLREFVLFEQQICRGTRSLLPSRGR